MGLAQEESFLAIKRKVMENAVFGGDEEVQYHLATVSSETSIGGVLFQLVNCEAGVLARAANHAPMKIIMFISLRMTGAESRYATTRRFQKCSDTRVTLYNCTPPTILYTCGRHHGFPQQQTKSNGAFAS